MFTDFKYFLVSGLSFSLENAPAPKDMTKKELAAFVKKQEEEGKKVAARYKAKNLSKGGYGKKNMYNKGGYVNAGASVGGTQNWTAG